MLKIGGFYDFQISFRQNEEKKQNNPQADITAIFQKFGNSAKLPRKPGQRRQPYHGKQADQKRSGCIRAGFSKTGQRCCCRQILAMTFQAVKNQIAAVQAQRINKKVNKRGKVRFNSEKRQQEKHNPEMIH